MLLEKFDVSRNIHVVPYINGQDVGFSAKVEISFVKAKPEHFTE
jgi:hypothetical protein